MSEPWLFVLLFPRSISLFLRASWTFGPSSPSCSSRSCSGHPLDQHRLQLSRSFEVPVLHFANVLRDCSVWYLILSLSRSKRFFLSISTRIDYIYTHKTTISLACPFFKEHIVHWGYSTFLMSPFFLISIFLERAPSSCPRCWERFCFSIPAQRDHEKGIVMALRSNTNMASGWLNCTHFPETLGTTIAAVSDRGEVYNYCFRDSVPSEYWWREIASA